jgi:hypothetical protein
MHRELVVVFFTLVSVTYMTQITMKCECSTDNITVFFCLAFLQQLRFSVTGRFPVSILSRESPVRAATLCKKGVYYL